MYFRYWGFLAISLIVVAVVIVPHINAQLSEPQQSGQGGTLEMKSRSISLLPPTKLDREITELHKKMEGQTRSTTGANEELRQQLQALTEQRSQQGVLDGMTLDRAAAYLGILSFIIQSIIWTWNGIRYFRRS